jgi:hypothetical protein
MNPMHTTPRRQQYRRSLRWFTHLSGTRTRPSDGRLRAARKRGRRLLVGGLLPVCAAVTSVALATVPSASVTARADSVATHPDVSTTQILHLRSRVVTSHSFGRRGDVVFAKDYSGGRLIAFDVVDFVAPNRVDISLGLADGFLYGAVTISPAGKLSGQVTGGSGAYQGDTGTITGRALSNGAILTVTYQP